MTDQNVIRANDVVTTVGEAYCVTIEGRYVTALVRHEKTLAIGVHMSEAEARALLAGLQEALA